MVEVKKRSAPMVWRKSCMAVASETNSAGDAQWISVLILISTLV
jgi:hypothetical protein